MFHKYIMVLILSTNGIAADFFSDDFNSICLMTNQLEGFAAFADNNDFENQGFLHVTSLLQDNEKLSEDYSVLFDFSPNEEKGIVENCIKEKDDLVIDYNSRHEELLLKQHSNFTSPKHNNQIRRRNGKEMVPPTSSIARKSNRPEKIPGLDISLIDEMKKSIAKEPKQKEAGKLKYQCKFCLKKFTQKSQLISHERTHSKEKPFICPECGKGFSEGTSLKNHKNTHLGQKDFPCPFCPKAFTTKQNLMRHLSSHADQRNFPCACGKKFIQKAHLKTHQEKCNPSLAL